MCTCREPLRFSPNRTVALGRGESQQVGYRCAYLWGVIIFSKSISVHISITFEEDSRANAIRFPSGDKRPYDSPRTLNVVHVAASQSTTPMDELLKTRFPSGVNSTSCTSPAPGLDLPFFLI